MLHLVEAGSADVSQGVWTESFRAREANIPAHW